jgi:hypothetical protein
MTSLDALEPVVGTAVPVLARPRETVGIPRPDVPA